MALKITLASGDEHVVKFDEASTLTVANQVQVQPGETYMDAQSWSEITGVEVVADPEPAADPVPAPQETTAGAIDKAPAPADIDATFATPQDALDHAAMLPLDDAKAHIDAALAKFPDDPDLLAAKTDLDDEQAQTQ